MKKGKSEMCSEKNIQNEMNMIPFRCFVSVENIMG